METKEKWTKPPAHFNEASILSFMENPKENRHVSAEGEEVTPQKKLVGLGTAATRHTFIPKLTKYGYIELKKKNIVVTELGKTLLKAVRASSLKSLADIAATTDWEERLDENPDQFLSDIKSFSALYAERKSAKGRQTGIARVTKTAASSFSGKQ